MKIKKKIFVFFIILFFQFNILKADILNSIIISGNERLSKETIIIFSELELNSEINTEIINDTIKKLYETNYFKDIKINFDKNELSINIIENPIIQTTKVNGIKNRFLLKEFQNIIKKKGKVSFY